MNAAEVKTATKGGRVVGTDQSALRDCLLARLRVAAAELAVMRNDIALIGSGLKNRLLTPHQAMQMAFDRDVMDWLFQDKEDSV